MQIELSKTECDVIRRCIHLEYMMMEFRRGLRKPDAKEKFLVKLWGKFSDVKNKAAK